MTLLPLLLLLLTTVIGAFAKWGQPSAGVILRGDDSKTRSGLLSRDHRCTQFPNEFPAHTAQNVGATHCGLWTNEDCTGTLYVVPAHYAINMPNAQFSSIIC
ncbi:hypothetical protein BDB00DRAFT_873549 [Zychaea mexicana]|uniref:uncharacterized protein n=1 Tax=Zychaea mexicana TaxID=64656 RepID=UPI0022FE0EB5|nr:uncharacterized protein BDB00DRAFT_873549 [Zychaea mexicana]KAI9492281.1 hypothetical protein BDB00DRAFT_873549 [Zychaea mexicana]